MQKLLAVPLFLLAVTANAAGVYKQPAVKLTFTVDGTTVSTTSLISTLTVVPYGTSKVIAVHILNNTAVAKNWSISINELTGAISGQFVQDAGCDTTVAAYATCTVNVTYTPDAASPDGTVQTDTDNFYIDSNGITYKQYSIAGYSQ